MKKFCLLFFLCTFFPLAYTQNSTQNKYNYANAKSPAYKYKYGRYSFYAENFNQLNTFVIPFNFCIWLDDEGQGNYVKSEENMTNFYQIESYLNTIYLSNMPKSDTIPGVIDLPTTKIQFKLKNILYIRSSELYKNGQYLGHDEGVALNDYVKRLYPSKGHYFNVHFTAANPKNNGAAGYSVLPSTNLNHEHFIITFNKKQNPVMEENNTYPTAIHLAHEFGHDFDLLHTYESHCNQDDPDYLDDVYGRGDVPCPHNAGWECDVTSPDNSCTNNIMGGTNGARYFSPKQIHRMHRAIMLKSMQKYTYVDSFNKNKIITIDTNETWDFNIKFFNSIKVQKGCTLTVTQHVKFVEKANLIVEEGAVLIVDGGLISNDPLQANKWNGIQFISSNKNGKRSKKTGHVILINKGTIQNESNSKQAKKYQVIS